MTFVQETRWGSLC